MAFYRDIKYRASDAPSSNVENLDTITFDGNSSYSLTKDSVSFTPNSSDNVLLSIDGVVQSGNFTITGSTIDFGVNVPATSECDFILHLGVGVINTPADGSVTEPKIANGAVSLDKLSATGTKDSTTFLRGDNTFATVSPSMYPAFEAYLSADQTVSDGVTTKVTFDTEIFDTNGYYDNSTNYRFTPLVAGKYFIYSSALVYGTGDLESGKIVYYKNGTEVRQSWMDPANSSNAINQASVVLNAVVDMNGSSDYIEIFTNVQSGVGQILSSDTQGTYFGAYRIGD
jgi:hypothetical protein